MKKSSETILKILFAFAMCCLIIFIIYYNKETQAPINNRVQNSNKIDTENINNNNININVSQNDLEEVKNKNEFKLIYSQRKDLSLKNIINKNTSSKYDFDIYTYGGDVDITINNNKYSFKEALEQDIITIDDIINKAKEDSKNNKCKEDLFKDGGTAQYKYDDYTILKYNTLDGNKDFVIGMNGEIIDQINRMLFD